MVEAVGLEPAVSSTRNWRDTTFATPRLKYTKIIAARTRGSKPALLLKHSRTTRLDTLDFYCSLFLRIRNAIKSH